MYNSMQYEATSDAEGVLQGKANLHTQTSHNTANLQTKTDKALEVAALPLHCM